MSEVLPLPNKDPRLSPKTPHYIPAIIWEGFADLSGEGGEAMTTTSIREEMTTSTTSRLCPPRPHNNKPFGQGEGGPFGRGEGGGAATVDAILAP